jgi:hypothetical protein
MPDNAARISMSWIVSLAIFSIVLAGCVTDTAQTVTHPDGRYQLYGSGTAASPYYWVWIPTGANPPAPPPAPGQAAVVSAPSVPVAQTVTYPEGRYQLYGNGTVASPYYWVWIPAGVAAPAPPPPPGQAAVVSAPSVPVTQTVTYPNGRYQLYGTGTAASPYYWVWIPGGSTVPPPPPLPR